MDDSFFEWPISPEDEETVARISAEFRKREIFDPPLPGSLIVGHPLLCVPDSDIKYKSFLDWWFAVGRKAPEITTDGWGTVSGPYATSGRTEAIPPEEWAQLPESEREAIKRWADSLPISMFYD